MRPSLAAVAFDRDGLLSKARRWQATGREQFDPWTAWVLSLITPGAGHMLALRPSALAWLVADGLLLRLFAILSPETHAFPPLWQIVAWLVLGVLAGEQVRTAWVRKLVHHSAHPQSRVVRKPLRGRALSIALEIELELPQAEVWKLAADVSRFHAVDPFHAAIVSSTGRWTPGSTLSIEHRALGMRWNRVGRLLRWDAGRGYAFSDLSPRETQRGFPHVFFVDVVSRGPQACRLTIAVRGRWNHRWLGPRLGMLWVTFVMSRHARLLRCAFT